MAPLLSQLLYDLRRRYVYLISELDSSQERLPAEALPYCQEFLDLAQRSLRQVDVLLADPDLTDRDLSKNFFYVYKRLAEFAQQVEDGPALALTRYGSSDRFMTALVNRICAECGYAHRAPLCAALSSQHYCAHVDLDLIFVPSLEPFHLLGLADVYHELAHFLLFRDRDKLLGPLQQLAGEYYDAELLSAGQRGWAERSVQDLQHFRERWISSWALEIGCDQLATYLCGPAYGWTNIRLCARLSNDVFSIRDNHPADEARAIAIGATLQRLGESDNAKAVAQHWGELTLNAGHDKPSTFDLAFPRTLLDKMADVVVRIAGEIGLRSYSSVADTDHVSVHLNEAWKQFLLNPCLYDDWEISRLRDLHQEFGF